MVFDANRGDVYKSLQMPLDIDETLQMPGMLSNITTKTV
jgi:hypothetical protein